MAKIRISEDPVDKPSPKQIQAANQFAKAFAIRKGLGIGEEAHVGNQLPPFVDAATGQNITNVPQPSFPHGTIMDIRQVPSYVKDLQFDTKSNLPYYVNQESGDIQYVHPDIARSTRFNPNRGKTADMMLVSR